jgi:hypothetical protein
MRRMWRRHVPKQSLVVQSLGLPMAMIMLDMKMKQRTCHFFQRRRKQNWIKKKNKERLDKKKEKEALKIKDSKEKAKKGEEMAKEGEEKAASKAQGEPLGESSLPLLVVLQTKILPPNPCKRDAKFAGFLVSRPSLKDSSVDIEQIGEFFCNGSLKLLMYTS